MNRYFETTNSHAAPRLRRAGGVSPLFLLSPVRSNIRNSCHSAFHAFVIALALLSASTTQLLAADDPARTSVIHLANGDFVTGTLVPASSPENLGWKSADFSAPFEFKQSGVASIHFSPPAVLPQPEGSYCLELAGGDVLFGKLHELNADKLVLEVVGPGPLQIDRSIIRRMYRLGGGSEVLFVGPSGLAGWQTTGEPDAWSADAGNLTTNKPGAVLRRDFGLPDRCRFELELSWTTQPDFELAIGVDENSKTVKHAYRFDVWDNVMVIQRETERDANFEKLMDVGKKPGRIHVQAFLDQSRDKLLVYSSAGEKLADLAVLTKTHKVYGGIQLTNRRGDIRLERLQIGRWSGEIPQAVEANKTRIHGTDGSITYGTVQSFDAAKHEFVVEDQDSKKSIAEELAQDLFFSSAGDVPPRAMRAVYLTGMKISGDLIKVDDQSIWLKTPGIQEQIAVPFNALQSIVVLTPKVEPPAPPRRKGRLEFTGTSLHGFLDDGKDDQAGCLVWRPINSDISSPLRRGLAARLIYRDPPKPPATVNQQMLPGMRPGIVPQRVPRRATINSSTASNATTTPKSKSILHLRTGDKIQCDEAQIDEKGLRFKSPDSASTFIPHEKIHALELLPNEGQVLIDSKKHDRLLTLPRMQRNNPPTHLIRSAGDGDYLRGRLVSMDDAQILVELRLEGKIIRRETVARIIWLHPELAEQTEAQEDPAPVPNEFEISKLVQAVMRGTDPGGATNEGKRLTFLPQQVDGMILTGRSEVFGDCRVELDKVDQLAIGAEIEKAAAQLPFGSWKLRPAADPAEPKEGGGSDSDSEGQESPLIGKAAPDVPLKTLEGTAFNLADHRGKVVVLDFWASWCGPCLQTMPQIEKVAAEFAADGVELFAINLEETPERVKTALERLKLSPAVLLDRNGRVAEKYGATSIPQTVIINREGNVVRVFVGGSARFDETLREALKNVLFGESPK